VRDVDGACHIHADAVALRRFHNALRLQHQYLQILSAGAVARQPRCLYAHTKRRRPGSRSRSSGRVAAEISMQYWRCVWSKGSEE